jgi:hypothetical protein
MGTTKTAVRTILITYGIAAYTYLLPSSGVSGAPGASSVTASAHSLVLVGLGLQLLLVGARVLIKRYVPDRDSALQGFGVLALIGDGVTVLLFALGTLGAILPAVDTF